MKLFFSVLVMLFQTTVFAADEAAPVQEAAPVEKAAPAVEPAPAQDAAPVEDAYLHLDCALLVEAWPKSPDEVNWPEFDKPTGHWNQTFTISKQEFENLNKQRITSLIRRTEIPVKSICVFSNKEGEDSVDGKCPNHLDHYIKGIDTLKVATGIDTTMALPFSL